MKKKIITSVIALFLLSGSFTANAQDGMLAEVRLFAGNFAPRGWAFCHGQLLAISSNTALFSLLGTTYGGDGRTTFALPDLRGRVPVGVGNGPGLSNQMLGVKTGTEMNTITTAQLPAHTHAIQGAKGGNDKTTNTVTVSNAADQGTSVTTGSTGGSQPVNNIQPSLGLNYIICMQGIFPSRS